MASIKTGNQVIKQAVEELVDIVTASGGSVHPALIFRERGGQLTVAYKGRLEKNTPLLTVPNSCMPYIQQFLISFDGLNISSQPRDESSLPDGLLPPTSAQQAAFTAICTIFNETGKVASFKKESPLTNVIKQLELLNLIAIREPDLYELTDLEDSDDYLLRIFLGSRMYHDAEAGYDWLLPLIDFVDHHSFADAFRSVEVSNEASALQLSYLPVGIKGEVFASYSLMDSFHSWAKYGFVDESSFFVQSVPFSLTLVGAGDLQFHASQVNSTQLDPSLWKAKHQSSYFYAAGHGWSKNQLNVAFLLIPGAKHLAAFYEVISLYLGSMERHCEVSNGALRNDENIRLIHNEMIRSNVEFYKQLHNQIRLLKGSLGFNFELANRMLTKQMGIIKEFRRATS